MSLWSPPTVTAATARGPDYVAELAKILQRTFDRGGNVVIPSFAVGRTQELLYFIREIKEKNLVTGHGCFPVYIDSPLAIEATRIFKDTDSSCFDEETNALLAKGIDPIQFPGLKVSVTSDESRAINTDPVPKVILSASGMCEAGRIRHHLKHNLWRPECTILFVGYQAVDTLGRSLHGGCGQRQALRRIHRGAGGDLPAHRPFRPRRQGGPADAGSTPLSRSPSGCSSSTARMRWRTSSPRPSPEQGFTACAPYNGEQWAIGAEGAVCLKEGTTYPHRAPRQRGCSPCRHRLPAPGQRRQAPAAGHRAQRGRCQQGPCQVRRPDQRSLRQVGQMRQTSRRHSCSENIVLK